MKRGQEDAAAEKQVRELQIKIADLEQPVMSLSGGNQQKVVVGNWLNTAPQIMFFDEPSRGIDVAAKQQLSLIHISRPLATRSKHPYCPQEQSGPLMSTSECPMSPAPSA